MTNTTFVDACKRKPTDRIPVWYMRQAGRYLPQYRKLKERYDVLTIAQTPELAAAVSMQPVTALGVDAAILFADIMLLPIAMGVDVRIVESVGPVIDAPIATRKDLNRLSTAGWEDRLGFLATTIGILKKELTVPLIGFSGGPFTLASYLIEGKPGRQFTKTKTLMYTNPSLWKSMMLILTRGIISYLELQIHAGVDAVQLFDSWVGCLSPEDYKVFAYPYSSHIFSALRRRKISLIHFATNTTAFLKRFADVECDVVGIDWRLSIKDAWEIISPKKAIQGNLDPAVLLADFPTIRKKADGILADVAGRPGFIFNLGHGVLPETPAEHLLRLTEYIHGK